MTIKAVFVALVVASTALPVDADPIIVVDIGRSPRLLIEEDGSIIAQYPIVAPKHTPTCLKRRDITGTVVAIDHAAWWRPTEKTKRAAKRTGHPLKDTYAPQEPGNALGGRKMIIDWDGDCIVDTVRIHGTTQPHKVRKRARISRGCIRMLNRDWNSLAAQVSPGTRVRITVQH